MSCQIRLVARIAPIVDRKQTVHRGGEVFAPFPDVVLIEGDAAEGMTYRYRANGEFCGDTWDESLEAAKSQAAQEYGDALGEWLPVPEDVENAHTFARAVAQRPPIGGVPPNTVRTTIFVAIIDPDGEADYGWVQEWFARWGHQVRIERDSSSDPDFLCDVEGPAEAIAQIPQRLLCISEWSSSQSQEGGGKEPPP